MRPRSAKEACSGAETAAADRIAACESLEPLTGVISRPSSFRRSDAQPILDTIPTSSGTHLWVTALGGAGLRELLWEC